jgi:type II secretory pathway pseudopilin PulG
MHHDLVFVKARRTAASSQAGYTLAEVLMAIALTVITLVAFASFNRFQLFAMQTQTRQVDQQTTARSILDLVGRDARRAGMNPGCDIANLSGLAEANWDRLRIQADLNDDGNVTGANEDVTYYISYSQWPWRFRRRDNNAGTRDSLVDDTYLYYEDWTRFRYFDASGNEIAPWSSLSSAQRSSVRRVRFELTLRNDDADPLTSQPLVTTMAADIDLRNRYFLGNMACPGS